MKENHKIILVKVLLTICGILSVFYLFLGITAGMELYGVYSERIVEISNIILVIDMFLGACLMFLMWKVDIRPKKTMPQKYKLLINNFDDFKEKLSISLMKDGYSDFETYKGDLCEIEYSIKNRYCNQYIIALVKLEKLTETIYKEFKNNYFSDFGNYLIRDGQINPRIAINVIYIICVNTKNDLFMRYTGRNVYQHYQRYKLPIGVDFESETMYVATQSDGIAKNKYNKLKRMFQKYISDIIQVKNNN